MMNGRLSFVLVFIFQFISLFLSGGFIRFCFIQGCVLSLGCSTINMLPNFPTAYLYLEHGFVTIMDWLAAARCSRSCLQMVLYGSPRSKVDPPPRLSVEKEET